LDQDNAPQTSGDSATLRNRIAATEDFVDIAERLTAVGDLEWVAVESDFRLLAVNTSLRRQLESIQAAVMLCQQGLGHLAVAFVRASLEDVMYLGFFVSLDREDSQHLFKTMGTWDHLRSLLAQREYVGDEAMHTLWYSQEFLNWAELLKDQTRSELKQLQKKYRWSGGILPAGDWIAERSGHGDLYGYLHAATSRALHFSAGEILRRGWGEPSGKVITDKPEFREHLAAFALDQLWRLFLDTLKAAEPLIEAAGLSSDPALDFEEMKPILDRLLAIGRVPLVHAHEWNLTPEGPLGTSS